MDKQIVVYYSFIYWNSAIQGIFSYTQQMNEFEKHYVELIRLTPQKAHNLLFQ